MARSDPARLGPYFFGIAVVWWPMLTTPADDPRSSRSANAPGRAEKCSKSDRARPTAKTLGKPKNQKRDGRPEDAVPVPSWAGGLLSDAGRHDRRHPLAFHRGVLL